MTTKEYTKREIKVADEVFIAVALLERENSEKEAFSVQEILDRAKKENLTGTLRPGVKTHAYKHAVANLAPGTGKYRLLYRTANGKLRLLRANDDVHPGRTQKIWPNPEEVPSKYAGLIEWAKQRYRKSSADKSRWLEGLFQMRGMGKKLWAGEDADEYVRRLREDW